MISPEYKEMNRILHADEDPDNAYGISGDRWTEQIIRIAKEWEATTFLDYGCGKGDLRKDLITKTPYIRMFEYDPAIEGKDSPPDPVDFVWCADVLEHVEPEYIDDVLRDIARCSNKGCGLYIATNPAKKILSDGRNAHLIQEELPWWFNRISEHMEITYAQIYKPTRLLIYARRKGLEPID